MAAAPPRYHVTDLGTLGGGHSEGYGINASGQVTGLAGTVDGPSHAFLWTPSTPNGVSGAMQDLGPSATVNSAGYAINEIGQVTGECCNGFGTPGTHAFLYDGATTRDLGTLGGDYSSGRGINASGQIAGHSWTAGESQAVIHAFLYDGAMYDLGALGDDHSFGFAINNSGQVTGYSYTANFGPAHAFVWTPTEPNGATGTMHDLGTLSGDPSHFSFGHDINASGQVAGESDNHAFLWTPATPNGATGSMLDLGTLGGLFSIGYGVNSDGQVVGWSRTNEIDFVSHAFLYTSEGGIVDLNDLIKPHSGWELHVAQAINDAGQITGTGVRDGVGRAFLLTPVPEPTTSAQLALAALGLVLTFALRGRRCTLVPQCLAATGVALFTSASPADAAMLHAGDVAELIAAIDAANQTPEPDTITLVAGSTYTLTAPHNETNGPSGLPSIAAGSTLTLLGNGSVIERSMAAETPRFRLFDVEAGASLALKNLTLQGGLSWTWTGGGGAISNSGDLSLTGVTVQHNIAEGIPGSNCGRCGRGGPGRSGLGGGIYSDGSLLLENSTLQNNQVRGGPGGHGPGGQGRGGFGAGGGLSVWAGTATLLGSVVAGNTALGGTGVPDGSGVGGGIYIRDINASLSLDEFTVSHVTNNTATTSDPNISGPFQFIHNPYSLPGDYNNNGTVDAGDYVVWRKGLGTVYTSNDYDVWRAHFDQTAGAGAGLPSTEPLSAAVPEPTSLLLCASSLWAIGIFAFRKPWRDWS
jgi:probable HAF family extracellular repeat protein